jgi:hypothetical protein
VLRLLALAVGVALLVWRVRAFGVEEVLSGFAAIGADGFALVLGASLLRFAARAGAWMALLGGGASFTRALAATIAGDAAGNLTPLGVLVSEPTKAAYVTSAELRTSRALAALAAENFFYSVSVALYVIVGAAAMLQAFDVETPVRALGMTALGAMAAVLAGAGWLAWRQPSVLSALLDRLPVARARALVDRVREFEVTSYGSVGGQTGRLLRVLLLHAAFHALSFVEMWLTIWYLTGESLPGAALVLDGFGRIANILFKVIPLQIGVHQFGSEIVAMAIGLPREVGLTSSLVRTARVLVWAAGGLALLGTRRSEGVKSP